LKFINQSITIKWSQMFSPYTESAVNISTPHMPGVYLIWVKLKSGKWLCIYAGQALDLQDRLRKHLTSSEPNECIRKNVSCYVCGFEFARVDYQPDRDGIEKFLYDYYNKPDCNRVDPGGIPIPVNLPM